MEIEEYKLSIRLFVMSNNYGWPDSFHNIYKEFKKSDNAKDWKTLNDFEERVNKEINNIIKIEKEKTLDVLIDKLGNKIREIL